MSRKNFSLDRKWRNVFLAPRPCTLCEAVGSALLPCGPWALFHLSRFILYPYRPQGMLTLDPGRQNRLTATRKRSPEMEDCERTPISVRNSLFPRSQIRLSRIWVSAFFLLRRSISPSLLAIKCTVKGAGLQQVQLPPGNWFALPRLCQRRKTN